MILEIKWETQQRKISELIPHEQNPRQMSEKQVSELKDSIEKFNLAEIPAINTNNKIIAGHQRLKIMQLIGRGEETIDVRVPSRELTQEEECEYLLRSNRNTGSWDWDLLANFETEMLLDVGFSADELSFNFGSEPEPEVVEDDPPEPPEEPTAKRGDVYQLGEHRLVCGDATQIAEVEKLMDGAKADMGFMSPPYNVGHNLGYDGKKSKYINSDDNDDKYKQMIYDATVNSIAFAKESFINLQILANNKKDILQYMSDLSDNFKDVFYWRKSQVAPAMASNVANSQVEIILLFGENNNRCWGNKEWRGDFSNYIETKSASGENKESKIHNATFPVKLPSIFIKQGYKDGSLILDLFGGSGSTLIACEQLTRKCYMMELDPRYVDVIITRWENLTGKQAVKCD